MNHRFCKSLIFTIIILQTNIFKYTMVYKLKQRDTQLVEMEILSEFRFSLCSLIVPIWIKEK